MSRRRKVAWGVAAVVLTVAAGQGYRLVRPPARVRVTVRHIPADARFLCLTTAGDRGPACLNWSLFGVLGEPFEMQPGRCRVSYLDPERAANFQAYAIWRTGRDYGVVIRTPGGSWRAVWFPAAEVPVRERWPFFGGGYAEFDCSERASSPLTADDVRALGLENVTYYSWQR